MKQVRILMGMPVTVEVVDKSVTKDIFDKVYKYFEYVDKKFSTYKKDSEISKINRGEIMPSVYSSDMIEVLKLCEITKKETDGYFNISHKGKFDPSGLVKGWAIKNAADILKNEGFKDYYVDAGSDIQVSGNSSKNKNWVVGIKNPFDEKQIVKVLSITDCGIATSGTYIRGQHVYNPKDDKPMVDIVSLSVIGPDIYEADRFATAAFAMGGDGIKFIEKLVGFEGYSIDKKKMATYTSGFEKYVI